MIVIVDYKMGNLRSIENRLERLEVPVLTTSSPEAILSADKLILPGVGAFAQGMKNLKDLGLIDILEQKVIKQGTPLLGICLGMQLLAESGLEGAEAGVAEGLGWIKGSVTKFNFTEDMKLRVPHVGWNTILSIKPSLILEGIEADNRFYFTHSYHFVCSDTNDVLAQTNYGYPFASVIGKNNIVGVQFHPETSHKDGIRLLKNFVELGVNATR